jgi:hypothetical protein
MHRFLAGMLASALLLAAAACSGPAARSGGDRVTIQDRTGETWDVTQARSLGYKPEKFNYGLGRGAIQPLRQAHVQEPSGDVRPDLPVIGMARGGEALAVSIPELTRHEVANVVVGGRPVAATY